MLLVKLKNMFENYIVKIYCILNLSVETTFLNENMYRYMELFRLKVECKYKHVCIV